MPPTHIHTSPIERDWEPIAPKYKTDWLQIILIGLVALTTGIDPLVDLVPGWGLAIKIMVAAGAVIATGLIEAYRHHRDQKQDHNKAATARRKQHELVEGFTTAILAPIEKYLTSTKNKDTAADDLVQDFLERGGSLFPDVRSPRLCLYTLVDPQEDDDNPTRSMRLFDSTSGRAAPRRLFTDDTPHGEHLFMIVDGPDRPYSFHSIPRNTDKIDWSQSTQSWQAFMAQPLKRGDRPIGVLMVDTPDNVKWTETHKEIISGLGKAVTFGLTTGSEADALSSRPELDVVIGALDSGDYSK